MNYNKVYDDIITRAKSENRIKHEKHYNENHHIIPICVGGTNSKENLVLLTAREHYICHKLLTYIYKGNYKIACAFHRMTFSKKLNYRVSSRDYAYDKELLHTIPRPDEIREKIKNTLTGRHLSEEHKQHLTGKKLSKEQLENRKNIVISEITRERMRKSREGKHASDITKQKIAKKLLGNHNATKINVH
jgi:hypothetical protein